MFWIVLTESWAGGWVVCCFFFFPFFFQEESIVQNWAYSFQRSLSQISNYGFFWLCN